MTSNLRIGLGYDLHRLVSGDGLIIGGVKIPYHYGFKAHSDGDLLVHALLDSLVSPLGLDDIGGLFPDTDPSYRGISSLILLKKALDLVEIPFKILNIDAVLILDKPVLKSFIGSIKQNLSEILAIPPSAIGIKGKTSEQTRILSAECHVVSLIQING